jgi:hypothetical protein
MERVSDMRSLSTPCAAAPVQDLANTPANTNTPIVTFPGFSRIAFKLCFAVFFAVFFAVRFTRRTHVANGVCCVGCDGRFGGWLDVLGICVWNMYWVGYNYENGNKKIITSPELYTFRTVSEKVCPIPDFERFTWA